MRIRLDSSLPQDHGWTTPPAEAQRVLIGTASGAALRRPDGHVLERWDDPLAALSWLDGARREAGRWVGFFAYELGAFLEPAAGRRHGVFHVAPELTTPARRVSSTSCEIAADEDELLFAWGWIGSPPMTDPARARPHPVHRDGDGDAGQADRREVRVNSNFTRDQYLQAAGRCIEYIRAGDVFQINLSQRLRVNIDAHSPALLKQRGQRAPSDRTQDDCAVRAGFAPALYEALHARAPASYAALIELEDQAIVSNSPELFVRVDPDRTIITRPIKGTRPREFGMDRELLESAKDAAELNMIIDLERNDLGRVCQTGSVHVSQPRAIEVHPTVLHGVATVEGTLREEVGLVELLRATFPGGSVTGAPKIRAMQIIRELEPDPRGVYCGAIGHLDADSLQLAVAIRTVTLDTRSGELHIPVGGGIVADSDPAAEYEETLVKARAALDATAAVCGGARLLAGRRR